MKQHIWFKNTATTEYLFKDHVGLIDLMSEHSSIAASKSEARRAIKNNCVSINKVKIGNENEVLSTEHLLHGEYVLIENGKKNKFLLKAI